MNLTSYGTPLEKDVASPLHYPLSHAGDRGNWIHHIGNRGGRNNQMVVICTIAFVPVAEKISRRRSVVDNVTHLPPPVLLCCHGLRQGQRLS